MASPIHKTGIPMTMARCTAMTTAMSTHMHMDIRMATLMITPMGIITMDMTMDTLNPQDVRLAPSLFLARRMNNSRLITP